MVPVVRSTRHCESRVSFHARSRQLQPKVRNWHVSKAHKWLVEVVAMVEVKFEERRDCPVRGGSRVPICGGFKWGRGGPDEAVKTSPRQELWRWTTVYLELFAMKLRGRRGGRVWVSRVRIFTHFRPKMVQIINTINVVLFAKMACLKFWTGCWIILWHYKIWRWYCRMWMILCK